MRASKVFRWIWRINALTILVVSLAAITLVGVALFPTVKNYLSRKPLYRASDMVNVEEGAAIDSEWYLSGFQRITGTEIMISPVHSKQEYSVGFGSGKEAAATRNYLFLNSVDKTTKWLVPVNNHLFLRYDEVHENGQRDGTVLAIRYNLVKTDTNQDGRLTSEDKKTFALSDTNGGNFAELVNGIDEFLGDEQPRSNIVLLFYRSDGDNFLAEIDVSQKKIIQTKELPKISG